MIDEAQGDSPEDAPAPPASTRWSEDPVQDDEAGFAPPYVPGREAAAPEATSPEATGPEATGPEATGPESGAAQTADAAVPFPFEAESGDDDFPFDQFNLEGEAETAVEEEAPAEEYEAAGTMGWSPADLDEEEDAAEAEDDAAPPMESIPEAELVPIVDDPVDEDSIGERIGDEGVTDEDLIEAALVGEEAGSIATDSVDETAALLERLARMLRDEGEEALRQEMESPDRLTALLSGLVAGYLSGRS